jgi:peptide deformylase
MNTIVQDPSRLRVTSRPIRDDEFGAELDAVMDGMITTLYRERGAGLAGVQVGDARRIILVNLGPNMVPEKMVNPVIVRASRMRQADKEGCLSFPGRLATVTRPRQVTVEYRTPLLGETRSVTLSGFEARCLQHEVDHLNGKTIL